MFPNKTFFRKLKNMLGNKAIVLMYHRIADVSVDPFELAIHPDNFEQQLDVLKNDFTVIPLHKLVSQLYSKSITHKSVCITFDDGYCDNYLNAMPLLEKYSCPASFFITTYYTNKKQLFWWDWLQDIFLATYQLPPLFAININGEFLEYNLLEETVLTKELWQKQKSWVWPQTPPTRRCMVYLKVWEKLKTLPPECLQDMLQKISFWAGRDEIHIDERFPMTHQQLKYAANHPLFDIGVHTVSHPSLMLHSRSIQNQQIAESRLCLEEQYHLPMSFISYPYGEYNNDTIDVVKSQQFKAGFTTKENIVNNSTNPFAAGRFQVRNWNGMAFKKKMLHWLNLYFLCVFIQSLWFPL